MSARAGLRRAWAALTPGVITFASAAEALHSNLDQRVVGDNMVGLRTSASNRGDFRDQVQQWAQISVRGMAELKSLSPIKP